MQIVWLTRQLTFARVTWIYPKINLTIVSSKSVALSSTLWAPETKRDTAFGLRTTGVKRSNTEQARSSIFTLGVPEVLSEFTIGGTNTSGEEDV